MNIITGFLGEPHVESEQDRDINIAIFGSGSYVVETGQKLAAEVSSNNEIKIRDGVIVHQGCAASIKKNTYDPVTITSGSQGMKRIDLIVARYQRNITTGVESLGLVAIQGTPAESDPAVPEHIEGDIQAGSNVVDMPLYQVVIDGLNIVEVNKVFEETTDMTKLKKMLSELNSNFSYSAEKIVRVGRWGSTWTLSDTDKNIGSKLAAVNNDYYTATTGENADITVKESGLYFVSMYAQGVAASGASAGIRATVTSNITVFDDEYILYGVQYSYSGIAANINIGRIVYLPAGTVLTPRIAKTSASGATSTTGSSYLEVTKVA